MRRTVCSRREFFGLASANRTRMVWMMFLIAVMVVVLPQKSITVQAVTPSLVLEIENPLSHPVQTSTSFLLSQALFGTFPSMHKEELSSMPIVWHDTNNPGDDPLLCKNYSETTIRNNNNNNNNKVILLVPRGECTFETKVRNAQNHYDAGAVIVYGTLESRYALNQTHKHTKNHSSSSSSNEDQYTMDDIVFPMDKFDYDCQYGQTWIPQSKLRFDQPWPYDPNTNNVILSGNTSQNMCHPNNYNYRQFHNCASQACLLTGKTQPRAPEGIMYEACCAWDLPIWLYPDTQKQPTNESSHAITEDPIQIPAAYMTMAQAAKLKAICDAADRNQNAIVSAKLYARWRPTYNLSAFLIWMLGIAVAALAAYLSASDYHTLIRKLKIHRDRPRNMEAHRSSSASTTTTPPRHHPPNVSPEEILELTAAHAAGFIVMASSSLLVLFYFQIYGIVKIFYAFGCSTAVSQILIYPILRVISKAYWPESSKAPDTRVLYQSEEFGDITARDFIAHIIGFGLGLSWLILAFVVRDPEEYVYFWVMQDVFGACMCVSFLKVIRLNSIRVASILLIVAFFYDIFFVFVTPYFFHGKSVMITVATSGGPPKADALWCEKYPDDKDCQGGNPLPMLLAIPKLMDYTGGNSLLGLGDIVLPGLLLSFAARFDAAKTLLGVFGGGNGSRRSYNCPEQEQCERMCCLSESLCRGGYFWPLVVAYGIGLAMANTAVYLMNMGQPALLYLVPCCLGTMSYIGWRRNELHQLWDGPRVLKAADDVLFGDDGGQQQHGVSVNGQHHVPLPTEEDGQVNLLSSPPSAVDDEDMEGYGKGAYD